MPDSPDGAPPPAAPSPSSDDDAAKQTFTFMDALLGYAPTELHALLWSLQDKRSTWVGLAGDDGPQRVADAARALAEAGRDVYVAVSLAAQPGGHDTRIKSANAAGIFGLWADIDITDPDVHKKWNYPPTVEAALELLEATGVPPSIIVHSGHGLQAWWLFHEFWSFDDDADRLAAAGLAQRWNTTLQSHAGDRQWIVDSVFDLARVMRVPGTLNRKGMPVMPVRLLTADGPRYNPEDIEDHCRDENFLASRGITPTNQYVPGEIDVSEANQLGLERFQALMDNDPTGKFEATFKMKRKDFDDQSPSSYDLSLATQAHHQGWSDNEITALIRHFRRTNKLDVSKAMRPDYIRRTIIKARSSAMREDAAEMIAEVGEALRDAKASGDPEREKDARHSALAVISRLLEVQWTHFIKYLAEPPSYAGELATGRTVQFGDADGILQWAKFRKSMWEIDIQISRFKTSDWDEITRLILDALEEQDIGAEATERGELAAWLNVYLTQRPPVDTFEEASTSEYPFIGDDGRVVMFLIAFKRWLFLTYQERVTPKELGRRLRAFGCEPSKVNIESPDGKRTSRGVWLLPPGMGT